MLAPYLAAVTIARSMSPGQRSPGSNPWPRKPACASPHGPACMQTCAPWACAARKPSSISERLSVVSEPPPRSRAAAEAALSRIVHHYGQRPEFVVLGGLVPELLCAESAFHHAGTTERRRTGRSRNRMRGGECGPPRGSAPRYRVCPRGWTVLALGRGQGFLRSGRQARAVGRFPQRTGGGDDHVRCVREPGSFESPRHRFRGPRHGSTRAERPDRGHRP